MAWYWTIAEMGAVIAGAVQMAAMWRIPTAETLKRYGLPGLVVLIIALGLYMSERTMWLVGVTPEPPSFKSLLIVIGTTFTSMFLATAVGVIRQRIGSGGPR